ncbi:MAG TPA: stage II sporulation protein E, partial [Myxococcales bacterium]|nr:stage II sporulation protein E [Myxococcales bacterium]
GWGDESAVALMLEKVKAKPDLSAGRLAQALVDQAMRNDRLRPKDDISCAVLYFRSPRRLLVMTGPPFSKERDGELVEIALSYPGRKAICGGTTASIISRGLGREVTVDLGDLDPDVPPPSRMEGVDLITEGTLTMAHLAELLEHSGPDVELPPNAVGDLLELMLESDIIEFVVGTRINEAHQDPNIPVQLDLRRNIVKKIAQLLEEKHLKETR